MKDKKEGNNAYVYAHYRKDTSEIFYIGIGNGNNYKRAYVKHNRTKHWKNIVNKTDYEIKILLDNLTWEEACEKEISLIRQFGRKIDGGVLVNLTLGGEGVLGIIRSEETREKLRKASTGRKQSPESIQKSIDGRKGIIYDFMRPVTQYDLQGNVVKEYAFISQAKEDGFRTANISQCCLGQKKTHKNFIWRFRGDSFDKYEIFPKSRTKPVDCYSLKGILIKTYFSVEEIEKDGFNRTTSLDCCRGSIHQHKNHVFRYCGESFNKYDIPKDFLKRGVPIDCYDLHGNLIKTYAYMALVKKDGFSPKTIPSVCKGKIISHKNCIFRYNYDSFDKFSTSPKEKKTTAVDQFTKDGIFIKTYSSIKSVLEDGFNPTNVSQCCCGERKSHREFLWKYSSSSS